MKLLLLSSRFPYPIEKGDKLRLYHQMRELAKHHEVHLVSLHQDEVSDAAKEKVNELCESVHIFRISKLSSILRVAGGLTNSKPFQVHYFYSKKIARKISHLLEEISPDVIYCQLIRMTEYVSSSSIPKVLDYMDCFSMNYSKREKAEKFPLNIFFKHEYRRLKAYELHIAEKFDTLTIISDRDARQIHTKKEIMIISNGIDSKFFKPSDEEKDSDLLFVGNMGYHPNILAAKFLVERVLPCLDLSVKVKIAGARPTQAVLSLANSDVKVTGWVDDIRKAYASSRIFVAPIFSGAGQQNKILEAMSMGMLCITTPNVNEAIGGEHGVDLFIAKDEKEFAFIIKDLLENPENHVHVSEKARTFVIEHFSWAKENKKLNDIIIMQEK